jgi:hypothetical protein
MKRASFFLPDELRDRLAAESRRSGVPVAELVRRSLESTTPPITIGMGELRKFVDKQGFLTVFVLAARENKLLIEPGGGSDGLFEPLAQIWVPSKMVTFAETADPIPAPLLNRSISKTPPDLRLNMMATQPEKFDMADLLRTNVEAVDEPEEKS